MSTFPADRPIKTKPASFDSDEPGDITHKLDDPTAAFAESLGFATFEELQQASIVAPSNDGHRWFLTQLKDNAWVAWDDKALDVERHYATREEALASVPHETETAGKMC